MADFQTLQYSCDFCGVKPCMCEETKFGARIIAPKTPICIVYGEHSDKPFRKLCLQQHKNDTHICDKSHAIVRTDLGSRIFCHLRTFAISLPNHCLYLAAYGRANAHSRAPFRWWQTLCRPFDAVFKRWRFGRYACGKIYKCAIADASYLRTKWGCRCPQ